MPARAAQLSQPDQPPSRPRAPAAWTTPAWAPSTPSSRTLAAQSTTPSRVRATHAVQLSSGRAENLPCPARSPSSESIARSAEEGGKPQAAKLPPIAPLLTYAPVTCLLADEEALGRSCWCIPRDCQLPPPHSLAVIASHTCRRRGAGRVPAGVSVPHTHLHMHLDSLTPTIPLPDSHHPTSLLTFADDEALGAFQLVSRLEGIIPALETSHALAFLDKLAPTVPDGTRIVLNCSGRGDKDVTVSRAAAGLRAVLSRTFEHWWSPRVAARPFCGGQCTRARAVWSVAPLNAPTPPLLPAHRTRPSICRTLRAARKCSERADVRAGPTIPLDYCLFFPSPP